MRFLKYLITALCVAPVAIAPVTAQIQYGESVPVQLEPMDDLDPCSLGQIRNVGEDSSAIIFAGPSSDYAMVDTLADGDLIWVCQSDDDMLGIVYSTGGVMDCELSSPMEEAINYSGPCSTGWIKQDWVEITAG